MDRGSCIITVYCLVEDELRGRPRLRRRGHAPALRDGEVLTLGIVGEYLGLDPDTGLYRCSLSTHSSPATPPPNRRLRQPRKAHIALIIVNSIGVPGLTTQPHPRRLPRRLGPARHPQLRQDRRNMVLHRLRRHKQPRRDLRIPQPLGE